MLVAIEICGRDLESKNIAIFIDNEVAKTWFIKGYAKHEDACTVAGLIWAKLAKLNCNVSVHYIRSKSNPADSVSRGQWNLAEALGATRVEHSWVEPPTW